MPRKPRRSSKAGTDAAGWDEMTRVTIRRQPTPVIRLPDEYMIGDDAFTLAESGVVPEALSTEPIYNAAIHTSLFYDDFTSYDSVDGAGVSMEGGAGDYRWTQTEPDLAGGDPKADPPEITDPSDYATSAVSKTGGPSGSDGYYAITYRAQGQAIILKPHTDNPTLAGQNPQTVIRTMWLKNTGDKYYGKVSISNRTPGHPVYGLQRQVVVWGLVSGAPAATVTDAYWYNAWPWHPPHDAVNTPPIGGTYGTPHLTINHDWPGRANYYNGEQHWYNPNAGYADLNDWNEWGDGVWHRLTIRQTKESGDWGGDNSDGRLEWWWDGVKIGDWIGDDAGRPEYQMVPMAGQLQTHWGTGSADIGCEGPSSDHEGLRPPGSSYATMHYGGFRVYMVTP